MHWTDRRERYRTVIAGNACVHPGSVHDAISARIAEELGFEVGMFAGSIASFTVLGAPDLIVLTLTEFAAQAYRINRAGKLPLMVDADHGYGNALNVMRTVQELETAGVAAVMIEDTLLPRAFGEKKPTVISLDEGVGKMRAALAAREDKALTIIGRTSSPSITGLADGIKRLKAYEEAGRGRAVHRRRPDAARPRFDRRGSEDPADARAAYPATCRTPPTCQPRRSDRAARAPAVLGRGESDLRHAEGAAGGHQAVGAARHRVARADGESHARGRLQKLDGEVPGLRRQLSADPVWDAGTAAMVVSGA